MKKMRQREEIVIRWATLEDVSQVLSLAEPFVKDGWLLKRSKRKIKKMIGRRDLFVAEAKNDTIKGICACSLSLLSPEEAEIRFVAAKKGNPFIAERLIKRWLEVLEKIGMNFVFLTTRKDNRMKTTVFKRCGFEPIPVWKLPLDKFIPLIARRLLGRHSIAMGKFLQGAEI